MNSHFADIEVFASNLDSADEADDVAALVEDALAGAGYQVSVNVTANPYPPKESNQ
ncbi:hypothetical protein ACGF12_30410 [Kitasatospora sp. NPDC048296]|uniref:hypothetical protein n=1 Tax=Kitasatospora sp. NPDC048296 TaxID=3364048 RepID=UPI00371A6E93